MAYEYPIGATRLQAAAGVPVAPSEPKVGYWYHGESERGTGAIAQYQGYGEFTMGDGTVVDMTIYPLLVEHPKRT